MALHGRAVVVAIFASIAFLSSVLFLNPSLYSIRLSDSEASHISRPEEQSTLNKLNIWADLDEEELDDVVSFLHRSKAHKLDLKPRDLSSFAAKDEIARVEVLRPNKTDALPFLEGYGGRPPRYARVIVSHVDGDDSAVYDYLVGPLPTSDDTQVLPLLFPYNSGRNFAHNPVPHFEELLLYLGEIAEGVSDITQDLLGALPNNLNRTDPDGLDLIPRVSYIEGAHVVYWMQFYRAGWKSDARSILPQGLYAKLDAPGQDRSNWSVIGWYYNGVFYNSTETFRKAWKGSRFQRVSPNLDGHWTDVEDYGKERVDRQKPPPVMIQPNGPRYELDRKQKCLAWMGFEFCIASSQATGVSLFDVRYRGDRVLYELGMQEALAHYAGSDPQQSAQQFLDTFFSMGARSFELVPGYDCPIYADYLSTSYHVGNVTLTNENNICVFEFTADYAMQRHTSMQSVSISRLQYLIVRYVSTVGNYDYTFDYIFYQDGAMEVKVRASGFIFGAFYNDLHSNTTHFNEYGHRIHDSLSSSMHDHVLNFKADFDVAGTANSLVRLGIKPLTADYAWERHEHPRRNTMHLTQQTVQTETGLNWPRNAGEIYLVMSNETNKWGERRAYRMAPGTGMGTPPHLTILNSTALGHSAEWATKDLWVVKHHDTEPRSASEVNYIEPTDPLVDFSKFLDDEDIVEEDLVVYFNLGSHHVPHSGDLPNTLMHTSASGVMFVPHNFHDRDPSREVVQGVKLELGIGKHEAKYFGGRYEDGVELGLDELEPDLRKYQSTEHDTTDLSFRKSVLGVTARN